MMNIIDSRLLRKGVPFTRCLSRQLLDSPQNDTRLIGRQTKALIPLAHPWLALAALGIGAFMAILDTSIVNVTLPTLQTQLHTDLTMVSWVLHLYNLLFATCLVITGRLADLFGRKRFVLLGLCIFATGSVLCGIAPSLIFLWGARALQAIGAAMLSAVSMALVHTLFSNTQRTVAMSIFGSLYALGGALGPVVGGLLLPSFGWRSIFLVNVPFCLVGFLLVCLFVADRQDYSQKKHLDVPGLVMISLTLFSLVLAIIKGSDWGWTSPEILSLFGGALLSLMLFVMLEQRHPAPLLDIRLFFSPGFSLANMATFLYCVALQGGTLFLSLYFLTARGETAFATGQAVLPVSLAAFVLPNLASILARCIPPWFKGLLGMGLMMLGLLLFCTLTMQSSYFDSMWREIVFGAGIGFCNTSFPVIALSEVPPEKSGAASGALNTFRQVGFVLGVACLLSFFSVNLHGHIQAARSDARTMVQIDTHLPPPLREAIVSQFFPSDMQAPPSQSDLLHMIDNHPAWQNSKGELTALSAGMGEIFDTQTVHVYASTWVLAAAFPAIGIGIVVVLVVVSRRHSSRRRLQTVSWKRCYFFSRSGAITVRTIQNYLVAQGLSSMPSSARLTKQKRRQGDRSLREVSFAMSSF